MKRQLKTKQNILNLRGFNYKFEYACIAPWVMAFITLKSELFENVPRYLFSREEYKQVHPYYDSALKNMSIKTNMPNVRDFIMLIIRKYVFANFHCI